MAEKASEEDSRSQRRTVVGIVMSAKMDKTRRVDVPRLTKHEKYGKYIRRKTVCYVHDEENKSVEGDRVEIMECRPMSKLKRWRLVDIVSHDAAIPKGDLIQESLEPPKGE
ncbi:30S ribosomal protein S17 [bacterium]|jgi:small subunit ribosomal protein S17|nr:30S ribosomal protein S17 [bacterium]